MPGISSSFVQQHRLTDSFEHAVDSDLKRRMRLNLGEGWGRHKVEHALRIFGPQQPSYGNHFLSPLAHTLSSRGVGDEPSKEPPPSCPRHLA